MTPMPTENIFDADDDRTDELGLCVPRDVDGGLMSGCWLS